MCGISAIYKFTRITDLDKSNLQKMNEEMAYRGPDGNGVWTDDICGLAHTRLSIIGLDNGSQPLFNEDRSLVLICNGEIYNYVELKKNLESKGHIFRTESDSETIIHAYEEFGEKCLEHLRGMFAFAIYDQKKKRLFAARDRVGEKTLYFAQVQTGIVFSTELKAILKYYIDKPQINAHALAESIRYNYPLDLRQTYIEQIKRLEAGEYAIVDERGLELHKYWDRYNLPTFTGTEAEAEQEILRLMRESVSLCLRSDVPVAVLLSGGIDSSAVAALAKETGKEIHVISAGYKGQFGCDERQISKQFASEKGLIYHEVELDADDFKNIFNEYVPKIDEPVCDVSSMSQWALYNKAKQLGFTVLLGGLGGDELFYGYPGQNKVAESIRLTREHQKLFPWRGKKMEYVKYMLKNWRHVLFAGFPTKIDDSLPVAWTFDDYKKFSNNAALEILGERIDFRKIDVHYSYGMEATEKEIYDTQFSTFMTTLCLYLADRLGMCNSLELRSPLVDYKLVEFVSSLPQEMKYNAEEPKLLLKRCLKNIVPSNILYGQKRGFEPPFDYIREMCSEYRYKKIETEYCFFNTMLTDKLLSVLF